MTVKIARFDLETADDERGLRIALQGLGGTAIRKAGLVVKAPGDYTDGAREKASAGAENALRSFGLLGRSEMVTVIGSEGLSATFGYLFAEVGDDTSAGAAKRLAIGLARGAPPDDRLLDRPEFVVPVADLVRQAMASAGLAAADVVHVLINTPAPVHGDTALRNRRARAIAALAAGVAIGDVALSDIEDGAILSNLALHTKRTQSFSGPTVRQVEVIVLGNRPGAGGSLVAVSTVCDVLTDLRPLKRMLLDAGLKLDTYGELAAPESVKAMLYKSWTRGDGMLHGSRTQVFNGQIPPEKHVRAAQSGMLAALLGTPCMFNTYDPVHQCPDGGAVACAIVDVGAGTG